MAELAKVVAVHLPAARRVKRWDCLEVAADSVVVAAMKLRVKAEPVKVRASVWMMIQHQSGRRAVVIRSVGWDGLGLKVVLEAWHCCCFLCRSLAQTHPPGRVG
jgi:hypothetical protein